VLFVGEFDAEASPLGAKGLGELTAVAVALLSPMPSTRDGQANQGSADHHRENYN